MPVAHLGHGVQTIGRQNFRQPVPHPLPARRRAHHGIDAQQRHPPQQEGQNSGFQTTAAGQANRRHRPAIAHLGQEIGQGIAADIVDGRGETLARQRPARRFGQFGPVDKARGAQFGQVFMGLGPAGGGHHLIAHLAEQGGRHTADAAGGAGHQNLARRRRQTGRLQLVNRQHGGEAGGANGHRPGQAQRRRQFDQPIALDPRPFGVPAPMHFANPPTGQHHRVADRKAGMFAGLDHAGKIDAGDMRVITHQSAEPAKDHAILVIDRRIGDTHRHVAGRQGVVVDGFEGGGNLFVLLAQDQCRESGGGGHGPSPPFLLPCFLSPEGVRTGGGDARRPMVDAPYLIGSRIDT